MIREEGRGEERGGGLCVSVVCVGVSRGSDVEWRVRVRTVA